MADFGENFRGGPSQILCPLCQEDWDNQGHSFQCKVIRKQIDIREEINEVYSSEISQEAAQTISKIIEARNKILNNDQ